MIGKILATQFNFNQFVIRKNLEGMSREDSLVRPRAGGSCANWVLGHIVSTRNYALELVGEGPVWTKEEEARYLRGTESITDGSEAHPIEKIMADANSSHERLIAGIERMADEGFAADLEDDVDAPGGGTIGEQLAGLAFHEAYHAGQLGILRRIAGKDGAIA